MVIKVNRYLMQAGKLLKVMLLDHIIIGNKQNAIIMASYLLSRTEIL